MTRPPLQWSKRCLHNADTKVRTTHANGRKGEKPVPCCEGNVVHETVRRKKGNEPSALNAKAKVAVKDTTSSKKNNWDVGVAKHG